MIVFLFYLVALLAACVYLALYGGRTGRWSGAVVLSMSLVSAVLALTAPNFVVLQPRMLACDIVTLAFKVVIALRSTRYWPIWTTAFQLNTVLAQVAIMSSPMFRNEFYYAMATIWAMPTLIIMIWGTFLDRRHEMRLIGRSGERRAI